jgi:hypothetical protein
VQFYAVTDFGIDNERPVNDFVRVTPAKKSSPYKGQCLAYHPEANFKNKKELQLVHNEKGRYHDIHIAGDGTLLRGQHRPDIEIHNRAEPVPGQSVIAPRQSERPATPIEDLFEPRTLEPPRAFSPERPPTPE